MTTPSSSRGNWLVAVMALLICGSIAMLVSKGWRPGSPQHGEPLQVIQDKTLKAVYDSDPQIETWLVYWRVAGADVHIADFEPRAVISLEGWTPAVPGMALEDRELKPPLANRYLWSPDGSRFVDYLWSYGEPDSQVAIYNRDGTAKLERLEFCGTACGFDAAVWLDSDRVLILGTEEAMGDDGQPLCGPHPAADEAALGCRRVTLRLYDFAAKEFRMYASQPRPLGANPYESEKKARWESGNGPKHLPTKNVTIESLVDGSVVTQHFSIAGQARTFEQNVRVRIVNQRTSRVLVDSHTTATAPDIGIFGPYAYEVTLPLEHVQAGDELLVEAFENSAEDGREINLVSRTVYYNP